MSQEEIGLVLSGTPMSGLRYNVDKNWALKMPKEVLIQTMRRIMLDMTKTYHMSQLYDIAKKVELEIRSEYDENTQEIYIHVAEKLEQKI